MPEIKTEKTPVILLNDPQPSNISLQPMPGVMVMAVKNDQVTHNIAFSPQEATQIGVALIQGAAAAAGMGNAEAVKKHQNGNNGFRSK